MQHSLMKHEVLDRVNMLTDVLEENVVEHDWLKDKEDIKNTLVEAVDKLRKAYQQIAFTEG